MIPDLIGAQALQQQQTIAILSSLHEVIELFE